LLGSCADPVSAFVVPTSQARTTTGTVEGPRSSSILEMSPLPATAEAIQEMSSARFTFGLCFYGALGCGSIGRELLPIVFKRYETTSSLESGSGTATTTNTNVANTNNDEDLGIWGYPEKIYRNDVEKILNNPLKPMDIAKKYPIEQDKYAAERRVYTHMAKTIPSLGYDGFEKANKGANPIALRAVFDSFSNSIGGSNTVSPITAQRNMDSFLVFETKRKATVSGDLAKKLNGGKTTGITAFVFLVVLLGIGDALAIFHLWKGWFPLWQGFSDMPSSLFDQDIGIAVLPSFFVGDVPSV